MTRILATLVLMFVSTAYSFAQPTCDQITIEYVKLEPLEMENLIVHLTIDSEEFGVSYPGFRIYDEDDNLIGEELVNFFGIIGESTHLIPHNLVDIVPGQVYNLKLELWSGFYDEHHCTFEESVVILEEDACAEITIIASLQTFNGEQESHSMQVVDADGNIVFEEIVSINEDSGWAEFLPCLDPGCYTYNFIPLDGETSNDLSIWLHSEVWFFPEGYILSSTDTSNLAIDFSVYSDCLIDAITPQDGLELLIYPNPAREHINVVGVPEGSSWDLLNNQGQVVRFGSNSGRVEVDVEDLSSGMYFLRIKTSQSVHTYQIVR